MTEFHQQDSQGAYSLSETDIRSVLRTGKNLFAEAPLSIPSVGLRLPAGSGRRKGKDDHARVGAVESATAPIL